MRISILVCIAVFATVVSAKAINVQSAQKLDKGFFSDLYNNVIFAPIDNLAQSLAALGAQIFAGIAVTGLDGFGKRDLDKGLFDNLYDNIYNTINSAVMSVSWDIAVFLAGIANNGLGKRDEKGLLSDAYDAVYGMVNNAVMSTSWNIAVFLAGVANNGLGKRDQKGLISDLYDAVYPMVNNAVMSASWSIAVTLANIAQNGLGKRDLIDEKGLGSFFSDLYNNVIFAPVDNLAQSLAALGAQIFAGIAVTGLDGFGKREADKGVFDFFSNVLGSAVQSNMDSINNLVQDWSSIAANILAGMSLTGISGITALGKK